MKAIFYFLLTILVYIPIYSSAQVNFRQGYEKANPVSQTSSISAEQKTEIHLSFYREAVAKKDSLKQLYGLLYLFKDYIIANDYPLATQKLLEAEKLATSSGNYGWQGIVNHLKGVLQLKLINYKAAVTPYEKAAELCGKAGDSLCLAESLEQLGAIHTQLNNLEVAAGYYKLAKPLIERFGSEISFSIMLSNYGNLLLKQDKAVEAIPLFEQAVATYSKTARNKEKAQSINNLAAAYTQLRKYDLALQTYNTAISLNKEFNMPESLVSNYLGLAEMYAQKGDYKKAYEYVGLHKILNDSLIGEEVQLKVADLTGKFKTQEKELALNKTQLKLTTAQKNIQKRNFLILTIFILLLAGIILWYFQYRRKNNEIKLHQHNLSNLTAVIIQKNKLLSQLESQLNYGEEMALAETQTETETEAETEDEIETEAEAEEFDNTLYNKQILTDADWASFKIQFDKAYPGFLLRLRKANHNLSEAEERLFLFIKLKLKSKEAAAMLGITVDSIKKTRNRLKKRLGLNENELLDEFIEKF